MKTKELEPEYVQSLHAASKEVFETMVNLPPSIIRAAEEDLSQIHADVVAALGFTGTQSGILIISSSLDLAKACCASMLFMDVSELEGEEDIADSFGEIANMITGSFKNTWVESGKVMDLAIPTVAVGHAIAVTPSKTVGARHSAILEFEQGELRIDLCFHD